ncbi:membrane integrity-associated transporter subunit PqiC [Inquilinus sp. NPDC058860]|uniref:PqiC family protein n=1 Tax=Inquilinus sp. NPDC058860 TaxID=3346652 RepID=UPI003685DCAB
MMLSRRTALAVLLAGTAACSSTPPRVYTLTTAPGAQGPGGGRPVTASVAAVDIPKYLDRPQIVRRSGAVELGVEEFERWGEPLADMVQRVLADDLAARLPAGSVVTTSRTLSGDEALTVELALSRFDPDPDSTVVLEAQWRVRRKAGGRARTETARITRRPTDDSTAAQVRAMSDALGELADRIARDMR